MTNGELKSYIRNYLAAQLSTHLRDQVIVDAMNYAVGKWCIFVSYPELSETVTIPANTSYADVSDKNVNSITAVYFENINNRLDRIYRVQFDKMNEDSESLDSPTDDTPSYYFYEDVRVDNKARRRFYILNSAGLYASSDVKSIIFNYVGVPSMLTTSITDDAKECVIPEPYCLDVIFVAAWFHYNRKSDHRNAAIQKGYWEQSTLYDYMMQQESTRDGKMSMGDGLADARRDYIDNY